MFEAIIATFSTWIQSDVYLFKLYIAFIASFLTGEGGGILVFTYAFERVLDLPHAAVAVFLGFLLADIFWFVVVKLLIKSRLFRHHVEKHRRTLPPIRIFLFEYAQKHPYIILICSKFIAGLRLILMVYIVSRKEVTWWKYVACNTLGDVVFTCVLIIIAKGVHASSTQILDIQNNVTHIIALFVIIIVISQILVQTATHLFAHYSRK